MTDLLTQISQTTVPSGWRLVVLPKVKSTNELLLAEKEFLTEDGLVVCALHQVGGKGHRGRKWFSVSGKQLQFSLVWHGWPQSAVGLMGLMVSVAVAEAVCEESGLECRLKWPNDVLGVASDSKEGKKIAGVLVEGGRYNGGRQALVIGVGVNVRGSLKEYPVALRSRLSTLSELLGQEVVMSALFGKILARLFAWRGRCQVEPIAAGSGGGTGKSIGLSACLESWRRLAWWGSGRVQLRLEGQWHKGVIEGVNEQGLLKVRLANGYQYLHAGTEVRWL